MHIKFKLLLVIAVLGNSQLMAQVTYNKRAGGPIGEAPKVGKISGAYSLDNVDRSTGTVDINIPLYEIKAHDISVPISISYKTLGIKVGQEAGCVGMGWELNAGGKMIKQVNGLDDDGGAASIKSTSNFSLDPDNNQNHRTTLMSVMSGSTDYAYDVFSYTVPSGGGRFTKGGLTFPYDPTFKYSDNNKSITTGNGLVHYFTTGDRIIVKKKRFYQPNGDNLVAIPGGDWYGSPQEYDSDYNLYRITSPKSRDTVSFLYEDTASVNPGTGLLSRIRTTTTEILPLSRDMMYKSSSSSWDDANGQFLFHGEPIIGQSKIETKVHRRLKEIVFPNGKVTFEYSPNEVLGREVLLKVTIKHKINGEYKWYKHYQFNYDPDVQYGHYLESVDVYDAVGTKAGKWKFSYYGSQTAGVLGKLPVPPNIESKAKDRWGFYNGQTGNKTLIEDPDSTISLRDIPHLMACFKGHPGTAPSSFDYHRQEAKEVYNAPGDTQSQNVSFGKRNTNFNEMIKGTLQSVSTPTGEKFLYEYEPHKYRIDGATSNYTPYTKIYQGGGIRIKTITQADGIMFSGATHSKRGFTYGVGAVNSTSSTESGYGIVQIPGLITSVTCNYVFNTNTTYIENLQIFSHPLNDLVLHNGSYAYYPSVVESIYDGPVISHQTAYYFNQSVPTAAWNYPSPSNRAQQNFPEFYTNQGIQRNVPVGLPIKIIEYNGLRTDGTRARVTVNDYKNYDAPSTSPKQYSYFGGVKGMKIGEYNTSFTVCGMANNNGNYTYQCSQIATIPNMDPLGYKDVGPETSTNYYPGKYYGSTVDLSTLSNVYKLSETRVSTWDRVYIDSTTNLTKYQYNNIAHLQPTRIVSYNSNGDSTATRLKYAKDFLQNTVPGVNLLRDANMVAEPVENLALVMKGGAYQVLAGTKSTFSDFSGKTLPSSVYRLNTGGIPFSELTYSESDNSYSLESNYDAYDDKGNPILYSNLSGPKTALIWGYSKEFPIAEVVNVQGSSEVAFTNFEEGDKSNWQYAGTPVLDTLSPSRDYVYNLASGNITKSTNVSGRKYIVGYWYKSGSTVNVTGGTIGPEVVKNTKGNWVFAERELTAGALTDVTISGTGFIDELRFHPSDAAMRSFTYKRGVGVTSSMDVRGLTSTYEYDNEHRLRNIKDHDGNIVKAYDYNIGKRYKQ
ncbi:hypothetical protein [Pedobacter sp. JY14-1]|uniref:hypothetical protein n=1 Tax=Pedobacter sp. JY14-1 TaxID=3034151 RepID=UPI0023E2565D|nr:hypothetical protein [Pedobacter sp. JY14-1]